MVDSIKVELTGLGEVIAKMESVKLDIRKKGGRSSLRKAAQVIRDRAKAHALTIDDVQTRERIFMNIVERWGSKRFKATGDLMFRVGVLGGAESNTSDALRSARGRRQRGVPSLSDMGQLPGAGKNNPGGDTFYWRFIEFGTKRQPAQPFMRPAMADSVQQATNVFISEYGRALDRAIKRSTKSSKKTTV